MRSGARRRFAWLAGPAVALLTLLFMLLAVEGVARVAWVLIPAPVPREIPAEQRDLPRIEDLFEASAPNVRALFKGVLYETNSAGFRGPEVSLAKPPGVFRVAVIGDSFTMGEGVLYEETYAALLPEESEPREFLGGRRLETLNFGLSGLNAYWSVHRFHRVGQHYDPDLVVYGYTLNDIEGEAYRSSLSNRFRDLRYYDASPSYAMRLLGPRWNGLLAYIGVPGTYRFEVEENYLQNPAAWAQVERSLAALATLADERGICAVVLQHTRLFALRVPHPFEPLYDMVAEAARERDLFVAETFPYFKGLRATSLWVAPWNPHPNAEGHKILHRALVARLRTLPSSCWSRGR